jgi:hypothetical protein
MKNLKNRSIILLIGYHEAQHRDSRRKFEYTNASENASEKLKSLKLENHEGGLRKLSLMKNNIY